MVGGVRGALDRQADSTRKRGAGIEPKLTRVDEGAANPVAGGRSRPAPPPRPPSVQRLRRSRHRDGHDRIAVLPHQPGQALALGADHDDHRTGRRRARRAGCHPRRRDPTTCRPSSCQLFSVRVRFVARATGSRARRRHWCARRRRSPTPTGAAGSARRGRRTPRPNGRSRPGCGDRRCCPARPAGPARASLRGGEQVVGMGVVVRRHLQRDALVQSVGADPVQVVLGTSRIAMPASAAR